jgi:hypothetical protein
LNVYVSSAGNLAFRRLLSGLNTLLRPHGFHRSGQRYGRDTKQCWQIIGLQKSRFSDSGEVRFTVNFGITSKTVMAFRGQDISRMPLDWKCPIRFRIGELIGPNDIWWAFKDGDDFGGAMAAITSCLSEKAIPLLDGLKTDSGIIAFYDTGTVMGFEIDRDETRAVLLAGMGLKDKACERLREYEAQWPLTAASQRAKDFVAEFRTKFAC